MTRQVHRADPLTSSAAPRWLKVFDARHVEVESQPVPPWADLRSELSKEAARRTAAGWVIEGAPGITFSGFFMNRNGARRLVLITARERKR